VVVVVENATRPSRFAHFWQGAENPLRLPRKPTSEPSKVVRACGAFNMLLSSDSFSPVIFSLLLLSSLTLLTSAFPSVHIVGSLTSKLPSASREGLYGSVWEY
jgi:hypothetical protein